ncbi:sulfotransferase family protein (plasmid) [Leisingera aquaemixtae]|uniref:sulfotransferase family protein n=1 Tax=Leisingera aquaemixtae TaxID=1396826 RepID=UPI003983DBFF
MGLKVVGVGLGRTGTYSLKVALNQLGLGPTYHMEEIILDMQRKLPQWQAVVAGNSDWVAIFEGYTAAVDWPTASYYRELHAAYPDAQFILTHRNPESWVDSFSATIYQLLSNIDEAPEPMRPWLELVIAVIAKAGIPLGLGRQRLMDAFAAHNAAVEAAIPPDRLLAFQVKEGWQPLCGFLDVPVPDGLFPRTNDRGEFWDKVAGAA